MRPIEESSQESGDKDTRANLYHESLRFVSFGFKCSRGIAQYDLVVDDELLEEGDPAINLQVLGGSDKLDRAFSLMGLNGRPLQAAIGAVIAMANWDPCLSVRMEGIKALGRFANEMSQENPQEMDLAGETLKHLYVDPAPSRPSGIETEELPFLIPFTNNTQAYIEYKDMIRVAVLDALDQFEGEYKPSIKVICRFLRSTRSNQAFEAALDLIRKRLEADVSEDSIREVFKVSTRLGVSRAVKLLKMAAETHGQYIDRNLERRIFSRFYPRNRRAFDIAKALYAADEYRYQGLLSDVFKKHQSLRLRESAIRSNFNEFGLLEGLADRSVGVREASKEELGRRRLSPAATRRLGVMLTKASFGRETQLAAAFILATMRDPSEATHSLWQALGQGSPGVADYSARALTRSSQIAQILPLLPPIFVDERVESKKPYLTFLGELDEGLLAMNSDLFDRLKDFIVNKKELLEERRQAIGVIQKHAGFYGYELLRELRGVVEPSLQKKIDSGMGDDGWP